MALRIKERGASTAPLDCKHIQESFKRWRRIMPASAIALARQRPGTMHVIGLRHAGIIFGRQQRF